MASVASQTIEEVTAHAQSDSLEDALEICAEMASVASQLIEEVTAHAHSDSLEDAREIRADGTYFPNNLRSYLLTSSLHGAESLRN